MELNGRNMKLEISANRKGHLLVPFYFPVLSQLIKHGSTCFLVQNRKLSHKSILAAIVASIHITIMCSRICCKLLNQQCQLVRFGFNSVSMH